jgi:Flp pilus assembly protein TadD
VAQTLSNRIATGRRSGRGTAIAGDSKIAWSTSALPQKRTARDERPKRDKPVVRGGPPAWVAATVLLVAIGAVYGRSLDAPFIFDDVDGIENNESIFALWPLVGTAEHGGALNPPSNLSSSGRPLVNLSLAVNYHWGGLRPFGYHAVNLAIHSFAALLLWAIVWRTLWLPYFAGRFDASAGWLALTVALLWALHPLQTEAVVYVTQRSELLMALLYLSTLYASLRYWSLLSLPSEEGRVVRKLTAQHSTGRALWLTLAVLASLGGMASKEVMVTAPLMILFFDRAFVSGSLGVALRRSWPLYVGLACTWLLLLALNVGSPRGKSAGFGLGPPLISWWMTQSQVLLMYLKLVVWPWPLLIHYRLPYLETFSRAWVYVIPVMTLVVVTLILLWRNHPVGYLLTWLFAILLPTSVVPILTEIAAERRMYLPLASLVVLFAVGGYLLAQEVFKRSANAPRLLRFATVVPAAVLVIGFGLVSANRLRAYQDPTILWREVVQYQPQNALAHGNLGSLYAKSGRLAEGIDALQKAVSLDPDDHTALSNLGQALTDAGKFDEAIHKLSTAVTQQPDEPLALNNLGVALIHAGRFSEAIVPLERAVRARPWFAMAHNNLGGALAALGKTAEAIDQFRQALQLDPNLVMAQQNLAALQPPRARATEPTQ